MNLSYGSRGDEVKRLQTALNGQGYGLSVDGIYGPKTQAAVRDYQSRNSLAVDGIAGEKTQQWLYNASVSLTRPTPTPKPPVTAAPDDGGRLKPRPNSPWVSGVVVSGTFSGAPNPAATGTSGQPHRSRIQRELREAWHTVVLPAVVVTAASSISPARCRPAR